MTLVEMLVSVSVLAVMILSVSAIMVQSQRFISIAQASRRSHRLAASISRIIRSDLRQLSFDGFLCISTAEKDSTPLLAFTTAGISHTIAYVGTNSSGAGKLVCYGQVENGADDFEKTGDYLLWRPAFVLTGDGSNPSYDKHGGSLADILKMKRADIHRNLIEGSQGVRSLQGDADGEIKVPVSNEYNNIRKLWQVLARDCDGLSIMWTDGQTVIDPTKPGTRNLKWYGIEARLKNTNPLKPEYDYVPVRMDPPDPAIEDPSENSGNDYRALWTHEDQTNWPRAVKVRFAIRDPRLLDYLPKEMRNKEHVFSRGYLYEIIVNVGQ